MLQIPKKKKTHQFYTTWPIELSFDNNNLLKKKYTRSIIFVTFCQKIEQFLDLFVKKLFGGSLKMSTKYRFTKFKQKNSPFLKIMS